ncbi:hypothetical protein ACRQD2_02645 [Actinotignum sp. GS-2025e]|uniref:hypothetical protein n=1 Tax=Actinotignum TaxID=1653174 RepID=UPI002551B0EC|nr:hypothetical protein [Actinotignum timonense]MDK6906025.1 hypothetical protein [Actinotignum timonense]MDK8284814.1 hypothetical protein [Actinotignum timonense]
MRSKRYFIWASSWLGATLGVAIMGLVKDNRWHDSALIPGLVTLGLFGLALWQWHRENEVRATLRRLDTERRGLEEERESEHEGEE